LSKVYSSMWQEEQDHQKTEMQWISKNHAECWTILEKTVQNCEMSKKCSHRHTDLNDNSFSDQVRMLWHHHNNTKQSENDVSNLLFIIFRDFHAKYNKLQVLVLDWRWCFADTS